MQCTNAFNDLSHHHIDHGFDVQHNFFESYEEKGDSDALVGVPKTKARRHAVEDHDNLVQTAEELYNFCKATLSEVLRDKLQHGVFLYVPSRDILRDRNREGIAVKNIRSVRSVRSTRNACEVEAKPLSCYCDGCTKDADHAECLNEEFADPWNRIKTSERDQSILRLT